MKLVGTYFLYRLLVKNFLPLIFLKIIIFSRFIGWNKGFKYFGFEKPPARLVSTQLISTDDITPDTEITHMVMQWGQFLDHDLDHAIPSTSLESWEGIDCKKSCDYSAPCFPMEIPENDPRIKNRR